MFKYNLCFIRREEQLLMLNRSRPPLRGLWQGVGGKLEAGETPYASVLREVYEETGLRLAEARFAGTITWDSAGGGVEGMYVYLADWSACSGESILETPMEREEGILSWKPVEWVLSPDNQGVPEHVHYALPLMLERTDCFDYRCTFREGRLLHCVELLLEIGPGFQR